jgi:hypothetical protein
LPCCQASVHTTLTCIDSARARFVNGLLIIEQLQAQHPDSSLHIRSVQDDGSGATVTITVEDRAGRSDEAFAQDVEALRGDLVMVQQRLQQEEQLRLTFEAKYSAVVQDILPMMMERALPRTEVTAVCDLKRESG